MPQAVNKASGNLRFIEPGWWLKSWAGPSVIAGITGRKTPRADLLAHAKPSSAFEADQVHGASIAVIDRSQGAGQLVAGCDAFITGTPGIALLIRTADCLPVFFMHRSRGVVALAHAGWRGLALQLPQRVVAEFWNRYRCAADEIEVAIGPAIRACCYAVGPEFGKIFGRFVAKAGKRRTCDLIGFASEGLSQAGIRKNHLLDTGLCTACDIDSWYSLRQEGPKTGRLTSLIMLKEQP